MAPDYSALTPEQQQAAIAEAERIELPPAVLARVRGLLVAQQRSGRKRLTAAMTVQPFASPVVTHWLLPAAYEAILAKVGRAKAHGLLPISPADLRSVTFDPFAAEPGEPTPAFGRDLAPAPLRAARFAWLSAMLNSWTGVVAVATAYGSRDLVVFNMAAGLCENDAVEFASSGDSSYIEVPRPWSVDHPPQVYPRALSFLWD